MKKRDLVLDVSSLEPEDLSHVWGVLTRVAEGLALDGHEVAVRVYRWEDDGDGEEQLVLDGPANDGKDQP
ncbi:hypothetical protein [Janibacter sp. GS2]|uniref:hypothetical protein n=1 Tax=Janibacter sp. GS2 TaxID=3442646 RepID=UPI003EC10144